MAIFLGTADLNKKVGEGQVNYHHHVDGQQLWLGKNQSN